MPRTARLFVENACQHILARGNRKTATFREDNDYILYLRLIHKYKVLTGCLLYGYCLMLNHIHLVLDSPYGKEALSRFMQGLNQSYTMCFNGKYELVGHLWQDRYKNFVVLKDDYLVNLTMYVEYNPVRAGVASRPEDYRWSSYRARVLGKPDILLDPIEFI